MLDKDQALALAQLAIDSLEQMSEGCGCNQGYGELIEGLKQYGISVIDDPEDVPRKTYHQIAVYA